MITAIALAGWFSAQILTGSPAATEEPGKSLLKVEISPVPLWPANGDLSLLPAGHSVFYSPSTDEYVVTTPDLATGTRAVQIRVASHRSVDFAVDWAVATDAQGRYVYSYTIQNGPGGHQHVHQWTLETGASQNTTGKQSTWTATLMPGSVTGLSSEAIGRQGIKFLGRLSFISPSGADLSNSQSLSGFSVTSDLAPGFVWARAKGTPTQVEATPAAIAALAPDAAAELSKCLSESWDTKGVLVLGPAMAGSISGVMCNPITSGTTFLFGLVIFSGPF